MLREKFGIRSFLSWVGYTADRHHSVSQSRWNAMLKWLAARVADGSLESYKGWRYQA